MTAANMLFNSDSSVPSSTKIDTPPEPGSFPDLPDLTNPFSSFSTAYNTEFPDGVPELGISTNLALQMEEKNVLEQGIGSESGGSSGTTGAGTGSSGGVNPGGFTPAGGFTPGGGPSPGGGVIPGAAVSPGNIKIPGKSSSPGRLSAPERARRREKAAESDKGFDCSRMEAPADPDGIVGDTNQLLMGRNPKSRFCCTGGPPISGIWDGIFYTNSPGKFITLRTNCLICMSINSVIIRNRAPFINRLVF